MPAGFVLDYNTSHERGIYFSPASPDRNYIAWHHRINPDWYRYIWIVESIAGGKWTIVPVLFAGGHPGTCFPTRSHLPHLCAPTCQIHTGSRWHQPVLGSTTRRNPNKFS